MKTLSAVTLGLLVLVGVAAIVVGVRRSRRARSTSGVTALLAPAVLIGFAFLCFSLFGSGLWHDGGREGSGDDGNRFVCGAGWSELSSRHGEPDDDRRAPYCHNQAVGAIASVVSVSVAIGLIVGGCTTAALVRRRRKFDEALRTVAAGHSAS